MMHAKIKLNGTPHCATRQNGQPPADETVCTQRYCRLLHKMITRFDLALGTFRRKYEYESECEYERATNSRSFLMLTSTKGNFCCNKWLSKVCKTRSYLYSYLQVADYTCLGLSWVWLSPCPSRPYSPRPQVKSSPVDKTAALCELPQEISCTNLLLNASTNWGRS